MDIDARPDRWLTAAAFFLVPVLILLLPGIAMGGQDFATPEEQLSAFAGGDVPYSGFALQAAGAVLLAAASLGVLGVVRRRRRGVVLGVVGAAFGIAAATALLLLLGMEFAQGFMLEHATDRAAMVDLALDLNAWPVFGVSLGLGLAGVFLAPMVLAAALAHSRLVPWVVPALFLLPLAVGFVPLPARAAELLPVLLMLVPCLWVSARLVRMSPTGSPDRSGAGITASDRVLA